MRFTRYYAPTLKEAPSEAEVASHRLMMRAGMIRKLAAGVYSLLPLGLKTVRKIENIVREEMDRAGAMEVFMPSIQPAELWKESGRWDVYGKELLRLKDRHDREFCYGPTHEEVVTDLVRRDVRSYRDLPVNLYQIQTKFRDEIRPRFGVMRGREFSMKDAYSFDMDDDGANKNYEAMRGAYNAIFRRLGLSFRAVEADTGQIGGSFSHEFMVLAESGEDTIAYCDKCEYAANVEKVEISAPAQSGAPEQKPMAYTPTPGKKSIEEVSAFLGLEPAMLIKTLIYRTDGGEIVAALCRGDHEVNHVKLARALGAVEVALAADEEITAATGAPAGFLGPVGMKIRIVADNAVKVMSGAATGANKADTHLVNVNPDRDFNVTTYADIRNVIAGDACPRCRDGAMKLAKGIEVGHIFKLGVKYSESMKATFLDASGQDKPMIMGCYGIGVGRSAAAAIEQNHDDKGIIWPPAIAPFDVAVVPLNMDDAEVVKTAEGIYQALMDAGFDPILDDRDVRSGVKFNDADLIGFPLQVVVGKKGLAEGKVELKTRKTGEKRLVEPGAIPAEAKALLATLSTAGV
ncbi:MAG: proline--tRNA ligase [Nitrospinae bacterium]|nr:proline--tRNA ligase [Nitrospinota bacterium]